MKHFTIFILIIFCFSLKAEGELTHIVKFSIIDSIYYVQGWFGFEQEDVKLTKHIEDEIWNQLIKYEHQRIYKNMLPFNISKFNFWNCTMYYKLVDEIEISLNRYNRNDFRVKSILVAKCPQVSIITDVTNSDRNWIESNGFKLIRDVNENEGCYVKIYSDKKSYKKKDIFVQSINEFTESKDLKIIAQKLKKKGIIILRGCDY